MRRAAAPLLAGLMLLAAARDASADLTAFVGSNHTPSTRPARGVALSMSLLFVGFEFEYSASGEDASTGAPALRTGMFNLQALTPSVSGVQAYGTAGGGVYREERAARRKTHFGTNVGGGVKIPLAGAIGLRLDYRLFVLRGRPLHSTVQRIYAGFNLAF